MRVSYSDFLRELSRAHQAQARELAIEVYELGTTQLWTGEEVDAVQQLIAAAYVLGREHAREIAAVKA